MTAPAARTLAEIVAEGRRLCAENEGKHRYCTMDPGPHAALRMLPALLAVAEAAVEHVHAKERWLDHPSGGDEIEGYRLIDAMDDTYAALRAAVRGEEKTNG